MCLRFLCKNALNLSTTFYSKSCFNSFWMFHDLFATSHNLFWKHHIFVSCCFLWFRACLPTTEPLCYLLVLELATTRLRAKNTNATTIYRSVGRKPGPWRIGFKQSQGNPYESAKPFTSVHHKQSECSWDWPTRGCDCHCEAREHEPMSAQLVTSLGLSSKSVVLNDIRISSGGTVRW